MKIYDPVQKNKQRKPKPGHPWLHYNPEWLKEKNRERTGHNPGDKGTHQGIS